MLKSHVGLENTFKTIFLDFQTEFFNSLFLDLKVHEGLSHSRLLDLKVHTELLEFLAPGGYAECRPGVGAGRGT